MIANLLLSFFLEIYEQAIRRRRRRRSGRRQPWRVEWFLSLRIERGSQNGRGRGRRRSHWGWVESYWYGLSAVIINAWSRSARHGWRRRRCRCRNGRRGRCSSRNGAWRNVAWRNGWRTRHVVARIVRWTCSTSRSRGGSSKGDGGRRDASN